MIPWKRTAVFLSVLAVTAGLYYWKVHEKRSAEDIFSFSTDPGRARILTLARDELINRITLQDQTRGSTISFLKLGDGTWRIRQPVDAPAESMVIDGLASLLKLAPRARSLSLNPAESKDFGFDSPHLAICLSTNRRSRERCLLIGSDAAIAKGAYAKWDDEAQYFLVDRNFLAAFDKSLYSVRRKQIFTLLDAEISAIHFSSAMREVEMKHEGKRWFLEKPMKAVVGPDAVNQLLTHLNTLYVKEFLDQERSENPKLGLRSSPNVIRVKFQDGFEQALIQGREAIGKDAYYALAGDDKNVILVSVGKMKKIEDTFRALVS